jgi:RNAse (barnase) inhibitor barstar
MAESTPIENGVTEWTGTLAELRAAGALSGIEALVVDLKDVRTKRGLLRALADGLQLPAHFGQNWDALADCLMDRDWLPTEGAVIALTHSATFRRRSDADWETLLSILLEAADFWRERGKPFRVYLLSPAR